LEELDVPLDEESPRAGWVAAILAAVATATATAAGDNSDGHSGVPAPIAALDSRLDAITARAVLTVCSTGDYKPFSFRDTNGNWSGVDIDMAGDLAKRFGVKLAFYQSTFATIAKDAGSKCDIGMGGVSITLDRARSAFFTQPNLRDGKTPITLCQNTPKYQTLAQIDQPGVRVIVTPAVPTSSSTMRIYTRPRSCTTRTTTPTSTPCSRAGRI
jgi:cyclohexadienyl dehydratase